ncbi:hypothetical protein SPRG_22228 [Saprolegnia parasitica CBS 223.65]|uniref:Uncharacterized protein n=1 Tax=Saprolegnia parasitica (strain CBS 223.65) TaxID=695850 RepID=A0A067CFE5_SAPPC|nr:hypothetical protein SPRG_22228 [Saprolegnia parasitica CBS 223.65]KDO25542.1 hypothetical protein SPRG_22228 [Saprolegnia parasitica CBS 223.65]|eukprot:XP_012203795.1 hypothetical protein SPRG_22228 [Saprolegnia parasitica CBS 223.65]
MEVPAPTPVTTEQDATTEQPTTANWQTLKEQFNYHLHELHKLSREMSMASNGASSEDAAEAMQAYFEMKYQKKLAKMLARGKCDGPSDGPHGFFGRWGHRHGKFGHHHDMPGPHHHERGPMEPLSGGHSGDGMWHKIMDHRGDHEDVWRKVKHHRHGQCHGRRSDDDSDKMFRKMHKKMARHGWLHPGAAPTSC